MLLTCNVANHLVSINVGVTCTVKVDPLGTNIGIPKAVVDVPIIEEFCCVIPPLLVKQAIILVEVKLLIVASLPMISAYTFHIDLSGIVGICAEFNDAKV